MCYLKHNPCMASPNQDWKHQRGGIGKMTPKYVEAHTDDAPDEASGPPDLVICKTEGGKLVLPVEVRNQFMSDPVRTPEWKTILSEFDRKWSSEAGSSNTAGGTMGAIVPTDASEPTSTSTTTSVWETAFPGKPVTKNEFEGKYSSMHSFPISDTLAAIVTEGPKLFLSAVGVADVGVQFSPLEQGHGFWMHKLLRIWRTEVWEYTGGISGFFSIPHATRTGTGNQTLNMYLRFTSTFDIDIINKYYVKYHHSKVDMDFGYIQCDYNQYRCRRTATKHMSVSSTMT